MNNYEFTTSGGWGFEIDCDGNIPFMGLDGYVYLTEQDLEEMLAYVKQYKLSKSKTQEPRFTERGKNDKF